MCICVDPTKILLRQTNSFPKLEYYYRLDLVVIFLNLSWIFSKKGKDPVDNSDHESWEGEPWPQLEASNELEDSHRIKQYFRIGDTSMSSDIHIRGERSRTIRRGRPIVKVRSPWTRDVQVGRSDGVGEGWARVEGSSDSRVGSCSLSMRIVGALTYRSRGSVVPSLWLRLLFR